MSEINKKEIKFDIKNRNFSIKKSDFKEDKKEQFLFDYLTNNAYNKLYKSDSKLVSIKMLDKEDGTTGTITQNDINIFLEDEKVKKKNITQQDLVKFIDKMFKLNPTDLEKAQNKLSDKYKNENGETIMTPELKELFGFEYKDTSKSISDNDGNVKKGMEIFDLNNDGKIDSVEKYYQGKSKIGGYSKMKNLSEYLNKVDEDSSQDGNPDGVISKEDKQVVYNKAKAELVKNNQNKLATIEIKDEKGNNVVTEEVKDLFTGDKTSISFSEVTDVNGKIKKGMEIFDLNGDGKIDNQEKGYFSASGHASQTHKESIDLSEFLNALTELDKVGYVKRAGSNIENSTITTQDKQAMHKLLESGVYMLENMKNFPTELQQSYADILKEQCLYDCKSPNAVGTHLGNIITVDSDSISKPEVASIMTHELTHALLDNKMPPLQQEVVTFFMEYKLYSEAKKNDPDYDKQVNPKTTGFRTVVIDQEYMDFIDKMKKENPKMSEKDIAVEAFLKFKFKNYNGKYQAKVSEDYMRKLDYSPAKRFFDN